MFSRRVPDDRSPNRLSRALAEARASGGVLDLTVSNPTRVGLSYPADLLAPLANPAALDYSPAPFGLLVLTASTSEAYSLLFKLLCDPGGSSVVTPIPSYPLFEHLVRLDGVAQHRYTTEYHGTWTIDRDDLDRAWARDTRAALSVSPNNPTGAVLTDGDAAELVERCRRRDAALIVDEVFCDYPLTGPLGEPSPLESPDCLVFRLGGLSKTVGLPHVKLGWIAVQGPEAAVAEALDRLELICDTYLSVSTPVQVAAPALLEQGAPVRAQILERIRGNYATLRDVATGESGMTLLPADGGWSAVVRIPATQSEEALVLDLIARDRVVVHPGYFFDFPHEAFLVISLLPEPKVFARGIQLVQDRIDAA
jgi:alanine-synthesizing transaminase